MISALPSTTEKVYRSWLVSGSRRTASCSVWLPWKNWIVPRAPGSLTVAIALCGWPLTAVPMYSTLVVVAMRAPWVGVVLTRVLLAERVATFCARTTTVYSVPAVSGSIVAARAGAEERRAGSVLAVRRLDRDVVAVGARRRLPAEVERAGLGRGGDTGDDSRPAHGLAERHVLAVGLAQAGVTAVGGHQHAAARAERRRDVGDALPGADVALVGRQLLDELRVVRRVAVPGVQRPALERVVGVAGAGGDQVLVVLVLGDVADRAAAEVEEDRRAELGVDCIRRQLVDVRDLQDQRALDPVRRR